MEKECTVFLTSKWDGFLLSFCHLQHCQPLNLQLLLWQLGLLRPGREERPNVVEALVQVVAEVALGRSEAGDLFKACEEQAVSPNKGKLVQRNKFI